MSSISLAGVNAPATGLSVSNGPIYATSSPAFFSNGSNGSVNVSANGTYTPSLSNLTGNVIINNLGSQLNSTNMGFTPVQKGKFMVSVCYTSSTSSTGSATTQFNVYNGSSLLYTPLYDNKVVGVTGSTTSAIVYLVAGQTLTWTIVNNNNFAISITPLSFAISQVP